MAGDQRVCQEVLTSLFVLCIYCMTLDKSLHLCHILLLDYKSPGRMLVAVSFFYLAKSLRYYCKTNNRNKGSRV